MLNNKDELRYLYNKAVLYEISQKFDVCSLNWSQVTPSQWKASTVLDSNLFEFYLTNVSADSIVLEVAKNRDRVVYSASSQEEEFVSTLFNEVSNPTIELQELLDMFNGIGCNSYVLSAQVGVIGAGSVKLSTNITIPSNNRGVEGAGLAEVTIAKAVQPYSLTIVYEPEVPVQSPTPWSGDITDINETGSDGDVSYIELTQIPYRIDLSDNNNFVLIGFDTSGLSLSDTVRIKVDITYRWIAWSTEIQDFYKQSATNYSPTLGLLAAIYGNVPDITEQGDVPVYIQDDNNILSAEDDYQVQSTITDYIDKELIDNNIQISIVVSTDFIPGNEYSVSLTDELGNPVFATFTADWHQVRISTVLITLLS
jgi:hypothetical protein